MAELSPIWKSQFSGAGWTVQMRIPPRGALSPRLVSAPGFVCLPACFYCVAIHGRCHQGNSDSLIPPLGWESVKWWDPPPLQLLPPAARDLKGFRSPDITLSADWASDLVGGTAAGRVPP